MTGCANRSYQSGGNLSINSEGILTELIKAIRGQVTDDRVDNWVMFLIGGGITQLCYEGKGVDIRA